MSLRVVSQVAEKIGNPQDSRMETEEVTRISQICGPPYKGPPDMVPVWHWNILTSALVLFAK